MEPSEEGVIAEDEEDEYNDIPPSLWVLKSVYWKPVSTDKSILM